MKRTINKHIILALFVSVLCITFCGNVTAYAMEARSGNYRINAITYSNHGYGSYIFLDVDYNSNDRHVLVTEFTYYGHGTDGIEMCIEHAEKVTYDPYVLLELNVYAKTYVKYSPSTYVEGWTNGNRIATLADH